MDTNFHLFLDIVVRNDRHLRCDQCPIVRRLIALPIHRMFAELCHNTDNSLQPISEELFDNK